MKVAIYARVSTSEQANEGWSIPEQIDRLSKYCESQRWDIYDTYVDAGFTGTNLKRPELQRLISDIDQIDKVVDMYEGLGVDRLATWTYRGGLGTVVAAKDPIELWDRIGENYKRVLKK